MTKEITVTKHAAKRIVERVGGNRKSVSRIAKRAYDNGYTAEDTRGNLRYWIESKYYSHDGIGNEMRLYSDKLYVFDSGILVSAHKLLAAKNGRKIKKYKFQYDHGYKQKQQNQCDDRNNLDPFWKYQLNDLRSIF